MQALFAALDVELFAKLSQEDPVSLQQLSEYLPTIQFQQLETLTTVLVSVGLLCRNKDGHFT